MKFCVFLLAVCSTAALAQELLPDLAPLAARHQADTAAQTAQKTAAIQRAQKSYLGALDSAEKAATSAAQLKVVAAIAAERDAIVSGSASAAFPLDLPKGLQSERRSYFEALNRVLADATPRQQRIDADYLRGLAQLQSRAATNPALAAQLKSEKERILNDAKAGTTAGPAATLGSAVSGAHGKDVLTQKISNTKWTMFAKKDFTESKRDISFEANGNGTWGQSAVKWEVLDGKSIKFRYGKITFTDDFNTFTYAEGPTIEYGRKKR